MKKASKPFDEVDPLGYGWQTMELVEAPASGRVPVELTAQPLARAAAASAARQRWGGSCILAPAAGLASEWRDSGCFV